MIEQVDGNTIIFTGSPGEPDLHARSAAFLVRLAPEALDALLPEERHQLYKMLRLKVSANPDGSLEMAGALVPEFVQSETVSR